jgi:hypothetical protein
MVLSHLGSPVDPAVLARESTTEALRGALITDLAAAARRRGFDAAVEDPSTEQVASLVASGTPVILLLDDGFLVYSVPHYVVAVGLLEEGLLVRSGSTEGRVIPWRSLGEKRRKMGNLALVVRKKGEGP